MRMVADGRQWLELDKECRVLTSYLAALGALKKLLVMPTPKFADLIEIVEKFHPYCLLPDP